MSKVRFGVVDSNYGDDDLLIAGPYTTAIEAEVVIDFLKKTRPHPERFEVVRWYE